MAADEAGIGPNRLHEGILGTLDGILHLRGGDAPLFPGFDLKGNGPGPYTEGTQENPTKLTDGTHTETIINRKGFTLPKTGDIGTAMFLIIGIGGMLAAVYIMLRGRKRA